MESSSAPFPWRVWCATAVIAILVFSFTLTSAVPVWFDDTFIVEYGRVTLEGARPVFGFNQRSDSGRPLYEYALIGGVLSEIAYRITAPSNAGPRLMSLLGQIAAFGLFLYYLRLGGMDARFSLVLALAFLLDPLCDIGWRGGRMDGWAFAFLFACISAIRRARGRPEADRGARWAAWLGGAAAACGFLCWPSFAMFTPLIVLEIWALVREPAGYFIPASLFAAGGVVAAALIIVPFRREFMYGLADARLLTSMQSYGSRSVGFGRQFQALLLSLAQTPIVAAVGLCGLTRRRNVPLLAGFLVALVFTFATTVYRLRVLYLLPYLYIGVASFFWRDQGQPAGLHWKRFGAWAVALMLIAGAGFTVAGTTLSGLSDRSGKNPVALIEPARLAVGGGSVRVFMREPDLYFAGRSLGWQQFHCFDGCFGPGESAPAFLRLLSGMDVAIFRGEPGQTTRRVLDQSGFVFGSVMLPGGGRRSSLLGWSYGPPTYGPYFIYRRTKIHASDSASYSPSRF